MAKQPKLYRQTDKRWASKPYRVKGKENSTIGGSGCGPTAAAMLVATFVDSKETPVTACSWAMKHGYKAVGQGTYYTFFEAYFRAHGMKCQQVPGANSYHKRNTSSDKEALAALKAGNYVIACMGPGLWTRGGHFVLAYKYENGKAYINDPASSASARAKNTWDKFSYEAKYYWIIEPPAGKNRKDTKKAAATTKKIVKKAEKKKAYKAIVIAKAGLNVRTGTGINYKKVTALKYKTSITVYETKGNWCRIHKTKNRWACRDYIKKK
ncbi:C39 family peptidase [Anaerovorax odorimutans]|uniref:C39 family peptidase n=1 Tax=Anaerovorax odorimutans TaxID=109327 RepID=A0ABT1RPN2_9FIRM|nr:C39 family peptidase [Anaerovorax odorimutans]MCQ4637159.1 C39 family peptidase [Anaerovorax odorimutans]